MEGLAERRDVPEGVHESGSRLTENLDVRSDVRCDARHAVRQTLEQAERKPLHRRRQYERGRVAEEFLRAGPVDPSGEDRARSTQFAQVRAVLPRVAAVSGDHDRQRRVNVDHRFEDVFNALVGDEATNIQDVVASAQAERLE